MSKRGIKLRRIRRLIGGEVPAEGVTTVRRQVPEQAEPPSPPVRLGLRFGTYRGVHRRAA
ncbi:hypothetical protein [Catenuloplanes atrovinosus]|uniref:Uncharacterized protein n=1 Tax=Catenuloplanes atrovinosus TaxID=137266 RepID=A0AAE4CCQ1_9ACTN|nr:hypothetical protein [Catenuloplanes atrovinosus]MDR7279866.1 hypothetical protein [Catenuloplanes atrovinosus]